MKGTVVAVLVAGAVALGACGSNDPRNPNPPLPYTTGEDAGVPTGAAPGTPGRSTSRSGGDGGSGAALDGGLSAAAATFTGLYASLFAVTCAGNACHDPGSHGGVNVSTQANAFNAFRGRVIPGNAKGSGLYNLLVSGEMPQGGPRLTDQQLAAVASWIDAGAQND
jgi:hypothetical protein